MTQRKRRGWVKLFRKLEDSAIWPNQNATRLFTWLLMRAEHTDQAGGPGRVRRGQVNASLSTIAEATGLSFSMVRTALDALKDEKAISRKDSLITITKYPKYQARPSDIAPVEESGMEGDDEGAKPSQGKSQGSSQGKAAKSRKTGKGNGSPRHRVKTDQAAKRIARRNASKSQGKSQGESHAFINDQEDIEEEQRNLPPYPPKGGGGASALFGTLEECRDMVLGLWREAWAEAGKQMAEGLEGRNAHQGAEKIAREYLKTARMSVQQLRGGMRKIIELIQNDPKCRRYDLRTLANNPDKYVPTPTIEAKRPTLVYWRMTCDTCGETAVTPPLPEARGAPGPQECIMAATGCQGTMYATKAGEHKP